MDSWVENKLRKISRSDEFHLQKLASGFLYALIFNGITFGFEYYYIYKNWKCSFFLLSASFAGIFLEIYKKRLSNHTLFSNILIFLVWYALAGLAYLSGGPLAVATWWFGILPLMASILISRKAALIWSTISFLSVTLIKIVDSMDWYIYKFDSGSLKSTDHFINQMGLVFTITVFGIIAEKIRQRHMCEKEKMQEQAFFNKNLISLGEMAAGIAHEINNPLTIIRGNAKVIQKTIEKLEIQDEKLFSRIEKINTMIERTSKIVDSLRVLSRDGSLDELGIFTINQALDDVLALVQERLNSKEVKFELNCPDENKTLSVYGVQIQLAQVLVNLINNAFDAVKELDEKWVKLNIFADETYVYIEVIDSGHGISQSLAEQIFTPFFTTKDVGEGTGLGLSLCHQILKKMNGQIRINQESKNTCFEIKIRRRLNNAS